jgi:hypothetical protein
MNDTGEKLLASLGAPLLKDLEEAGLTRKKLIQELKEQLEAVEIKPFNANGRIIYSDGQPNWTIRQGALVIALKLSNFYPKEVIGVEEGLNINVINFARSIAKMTDEEIQDRISSLLEKHEEGIEEGEPAIKVVDYKSDPKRGKP